MLANFGTALSAFPDEDLDISSQFEQSKAVSTMPNIGGVSLTQKRTTRNVSPKQHDVNTNFVKSRFLQIQISSKKKLHCFKT
jgi:hypothetical protein